jgi:hypothetical protein
MDQAFTLHLGLTMRLSARNAPPVEDDEILLAAGPWRGWQQAADALDSAEEVEDFQAVGEEDLLPGLRATRGTSVGLPQRP